MEGGGAGGDTGEKRTGAEISRDGAQVADLAGGERGYGGSRVKWEEVSAAMSHHRNAKRGARRSGRPSTSSSGG